ncbi:MAG: hypothetical protein AAB365_03845 [Patescibacteria group bacterium]
MKRQSVKPIANGVVLMRELFAHICATAGTVEIELFGNDIVALLKGGPNDKQAVRLCRETEKVTIEFHSIDAFACSTDHEKDAWCKLSMFLDSTDVSDLKLGKMRVTAFHVSHGDIVLLTSMSRNIMPYVTLFYSWVERLEKYHMWEHEIKEATKGDLVHITKLIGNRTQKATKTT